MNRDDVSTWLLRYIDAWKSYDRAAIADLFSSDVTYRYHPCEEPLRGRDAIVASWLEEPDPPGSFEARYEPIAVDGDVAVALGTSTYFDEDGKPDRIYHNNFVMRFDADGRCVEFTEYYLKQP